MPSVCPVTTCSTALPWTFQMRACAAQDGPSKGRGQLEVGSAGGGQRGLASCGGHPCLHARLLTAGVHRASDLSQGSRARSPWHTLWRITPRSQLHTTSSQQGRSKRLAKQPREQGMHRAVLGARYGAQTLVPSYTPQARSRGAASAWQNSRGSRACTVQSLAHVMARKPPFPAARHKLTAGAQQAPGKTAEGAGHAPCSP